MAPNEQLNNQVNSLNNRTQRIMDDMEDLKNVVKELETRYKKLAVVVAKQGKND